MHLHSRPLRHLQLSYRFSDDLAVARQWAGSTCFGVWEPEKVGMEFVAQTGSPLPLRVEDVHAARAELESNGNHLRLHRRYAP